MSKVKEKPKKVVVVGDGYVGKTSLLNAFVKKTFFTDYEPTVFETTSRDVNINGLTITLNLWDTGGQEDYEHIRILSYPADLIILCYAVDIPSSLNNILDIWKPELDIHSPKAPIILVGCKSDLRDRYFDNKQKSAELVSSEDSVKIRQTICAKGHLECSARTGSNVDAVFDMAAEILLQKSHKKLSFLRKFSCFDFSKK
uniref:Rho3 GTPase n=1 Tax=Dugesia japonica TaxID=6161 RepID=F2W7E2_DUGJA|nr:Rho3 GTPase [Dugesia japonica]